MKNKRGRPRVCKAARDTQVYFRTTTAERLRIAKTAKRKGVTVAELIRSSLRDSGVVLDG